MNDDGTPMPEGTLILMTRLDSKRHGILYDKFLRFKQALLIWLLFRHVATFQLVNGSYFMHMITVLSADIAETMPGRNVIRQWIIARYAKEQRRLFGGN
jgi:hypothetical protein